MTPASPIRKITFAAMPVPAKVLATCVILTLALGMAGALGQIWVHDIVPTFYSDGDSSHGQAADEKQKEIMAGHAASSSVASRGDLFSDLTVDKAVPKETSLLQNERFIWVLKWTHIHLFGMNMIFILMGGVSLLLDVIAKLRVWLIALPFVGVLVDILAMWLKGFISPVFFYLHIPGGGLFAGVFAYVSVRALWEMWWASKSR